MLNWTNDVPKGCLHVFQTTLKNKPINHILEIGCFHGTSIVGFLDILPGAKAVCVDKWDTNNAELSHIDFNNVEKQFDENTAHYKNRIVKRKGDSRKVLHELIQEKQQFDLIYIDGSHRCLDVYHDTILSWILLRKNGLLLFDDFNWETKTKDKFDIPYYAIKEFLEVYKGQYKLIMKHYRVFVQKIV